MLSQCNCYTSETYQILSPVLFQQSLYFLLLIHRIFYLLVIIKTQQKTQYTHEQGALDGRNGWEVLWSGKACSGIVSNSYYGRRYNGHNTRMPGAPWNQNRHWYLIATMVEDIMGKIHVCLVPHGIKTGMRCNQCLNYTYSISEWFSLYFVQ